MSRVIVMLTFLVSLMATTPANAQDQDWVSNSNAYSRQVMDMQAQFQPEGASINGLAQYDGLVMDLGPNIEERQIAAYEAQIAKLEKSLAQETDPRIKQDLEILIDSLEEGVEGSD
jgi:hypothetical protein